jgi:hypothetical protein
MSGLEMFAISFGIAFIVASDRFKQLLTHIGFLKNR